mgnify:FL=1
MAIIEIKTNPTRRDLRWFGVLLPFFFAIVGALVWQRTGVVSLAAVLWAVGGAISTSFALWPASRRRIYVGWMYGVYPIGWLVSHLLLGVVYFIIITPIGFGLRFLRRDPLQRRFDRGIKTYWIQHDPPGRVERYFRQF